MHFRQKPLEVRRDLDVHGRGNGGRDAAHLIAARFQRAHQNVVAVGGNHQLVDRQAHAHGGVARKDIAEIAGRHGEGYGTVRRANGNACHEVIDDLRQNARPVDRVHTRQAHPVAEIKVVEHALHDGLAIIEIAFHRQCMNIGFRGRRHLAALHVGHAPFGEEDEHIRALAAAEGLDGRTTRVA